MTVKELIEELKQIPQDLTVLVREADPGFRDPRIVTGKVYKQEKPDGSWYWEMAYEFQDGEKVVTL